MGLLLVLLSGCAALAPSAPSASPAAAGRVQLHIESPRTVTLFDSAAVGADRQREVCTSPCDIVVDGSDGQVFYVGGFGVVQSDAFLLVDKAGPWTLHVDPGDAGARLWGLVAGGAGAIVGLLGLVAALDADETDDPGLAAAFLVGGAIATVAGAIATGTGAVLWFANETHVELTAAQRGPQ